MYVTLSYFYTVNTCCSKIVLNGTNELKQVHSDKLGIYEKTTVADNDQVFKLSGKDYYLHRSPSMKWTVR